LKKIGSLDLSFFVGDVIIGSL